MAELFLEKAQLPPGPTTELQRQAEWVQCIPSTWEVAQKDSQFEAFEETFCFEGKTEGGRRKSVRLRGRNI